MRVATWNLKAVAPRAPLPVRKQWLLERVRPAIAVLTEADKRAAAEWSDINVTGHAAGLSKTQHFSTLIVAPGCSIEPLTAVGKRRRMRQLDEWWPGTFVAVDAFRDGDYWATVAGIYGIIRADGGAHLEGGWESIPRLMDDVEAIIDSGRDRLIVAGDLNILPVDLPNDFRDLGLTNLTDHTAADRAPLAGCTGCNLGAARCGHFWTHKNGKKDGNGVPQQIDHIFASKKMVRDFVSIDGGIGSYPDSLDVSDHAPLVADFR